MYYNLLLNVFIRKRLIRELSRVLETTKGIMEKLKNHGVRVDLPEYLYVNEGWCNLK